MASAKDSQPAFPGWYPSHDTALCLIPPQHLWERIDRLRALYDKAHNKWPPHINILYPFVQPESLEYVLGELQPALDLSHVATDTSIIRLDQVGVFNRVFNAVSAGGSTNTIHLHPSKDSDTYGKLARLRAVAPDSFRKSLSARFKANFNPHMTIAQSSDVRTDSHKFLLEKARCIAPIEWEAAQLAVLVRNKTDGESSKEGEMRLWGYVEPGKKLIKFDEPRKFYGEAVDGSAQAPPQPTYEYDDSTAAWVPRSLDQDGSSMEVDLERLIVASYNVLAEFEWPPSLERHPGLIGTILSRRSTADILVLQEVTDQFLVSLLGHQGVRQRYAYSSWGPPNEPEIGPLPSLLNVVVLSKYPFSWTLLSSNRKHKASVVATFPSLTGCGADAGKPLVLAACHLSQGLNDGAVNAKQAEIQGLLRHLSLRCEGHPWIIAGDFNLATSVYTLDTARRQTDLSARSYDYCRNFNSVLAESGLQDAWIASKVLSGESSEPAGKPRSLLDAYEGEQGATFDPLVNKLAARMLGSGLNNRPQRYDRILVNSHCRLRPRRFNMFGLPSDKADADQPDETPSDHWGIRCLFEASSSNAEDARALPKAEILACRSENVLGDFDKIKEELRIRGILPSADDGQRRKNAIQLLELILQCTSKEQTQYDPRAGPRLLLLPVGSFAMGLWTPASDVDCLCVGEISSRTFFSLAIQRLRKAAAYGIAIIRRVKAASGTMLELDVQGIKFDLQYCSAPSLLDEFPDVLKRPSDDDAFALPPSVLSKLKPLRDLSYLQRSVPDLAQFTIVHLFLSTWARNRGLYGAKFGLLGSIHITVMLVPICKTLALQLGTVSVEEVITTFFEHYASLDWKTHAVFDPFFHESLKYHRTFREPLCLLGWHGPSLNTAASASVPTVTTLAEELRHAGDNITKQKVSIDYFLGPSTTDGNRQNTSGVEDFLSGYKSFAKVNVHYWGSSSTAGAKFVGWVESRCVTLLIDLDRKVPSLAARIWPQRFTAEAANPGSDEVEAGPSCHGCYLIGLSWQSDPSREHRSTEDAKLAEGSLQTVLRQFENRIRGDDRYYDADSCWMSAEVVRRAEVSALSIDRYHPGDSLGEHGMSDDEEMPEDDDEDEQGQDDDDDDDDEARQLRQRGGIISENVSVPGKFRTAKDVMNRIRWDAALDSSDYIIGYEDRFVGTRERALELWKSEQTDEEFIPQHRILYFKRRSDDVIVWERRARVDDVFGSGVSR